MQIFPLGTPVIYISDRRIAHHAFICAADYSKCINDSDRPVVNLAVYSNRGHVSAKERVEPAKHNGLRWIVLHKWALPDELPKEEYLLPEISTYSSLT